MNTASTILDGGKVLWTKIGDYQAVETTQEIASKSGSLHELKSKLREDIENDRIKDKDELNNRIDKLIDAIDALRGSLDRFAYEIDSAHLNSSTDLRITTAYLAGNKIEELYKVRAVWTHDDESSHQQAIKYLDSAIECLEKFHQTATCLANTVRNQRRDANPECTSDSIKKSASECKTKTSAAN
jgi:predicted nuclease with TOPRIM domain